METETLLYLAKMGDEGAKEELFLRYRPLLIEYSNASEPPFYRLRATSDFNTLEPPQTQDIVMEP